MDETNVPYPRRAKRVNMRKLKTMILSCLIEDDNANTVDHDSIKKTSVKPTKFTDVHRKLLQKLPLQMKNEISIPVVFFALLQLATQHDLTISGCPSLNDAIIEKH
ncbi:hypothetical protein AMK59_2968 [Oryctes borbonicus]|uniref:Condensin complex subunit 2 n=1 Tax=Oryctes borbonicus TaxID=1629725 RepID=A0A0T6BAX8_9SCAR|nr:hypothetical protein AMK59_2968 [Oryctes borbonicus]